MKESKINVAAFTGGVDGNAEADLRRANFVVAAFTGGVDGNIMGANGTVYMGVAAFTGGVDGSFRVRIVGYAEPASPPSRAAWIEISSGKA